MWETTDANRRLVELSFARWRHIVEEHPELRLTPTILLSIVSDPDRRRPGHEFGEEWCYGRDLGPSHWVRVVVHYEDDRGQVVTAFPRRAFP